MTNLPDDFNPWLFDATIASAMSGYQEMMQECLPELQKGVRRMASRWPEEISRDQALQNIRGIVLTFVREQAKHGTVVPDRALQEFFLDVQEQLAAAESLEGLCAALDDAVYALVHAVAKFNYPND